MNEQAYYDHAAQNQDYELDESDSDHQIVVLDPGISDALNKLLTRHTITNDGSQSQEDM